MRARRRIVAGLAVSAISVGIAALGTTAGVAGTTEEECLSGVLPTVETFTLDDGQASVILYGSDDLIIVGDPDNLEEAFIAQGCVVQFRFSKHVVGDGPTGPFEFQLSCSGFTCQLTETNALGATSGTCLETPCQVDIPPCELTGSNAAIGEGGLELAADSGAPGGCAFFVDFGTVENVFPAGTDGDNGSGSPGSSGTSVSGSGGSGGSDGSGATTRTATAEAVDADPRFNG